MEYIDVINEETKLNAKLKELEEKTLKSGLKKKLLVVILPTAESLIRSTIHDN